MYLAGLSIMVTMGYFQERLRGLRGGWLPPVSFLRPVRHQKIKVVRFFGFGKLQKNSATPSTSPKTAPGHLVSERVDCVKDCILLSTPPARLIFSASSWAILTSSLGADRVPALRTRNRIPLPEWYSAAVVAELLIVYSELLTSASAVGCVLRQRPKLRSSVAAQDDWWPPDRAFPVAAAKIWNGLPPPITSSSAFLLQFRRAQKTELFRCYGDAHHRTTTWLRPCSLPRRHLERQGHRFY
jgi:hypothetical protein